MANSQALPTPSYSAMHEFVGQCYIPLNYLFSRLMSPCILSCPVPGSLPYLWSSLSFLPEPCPVFCLRDEDQTCMQYSSPGSTTELPSCTLISSALFSTLLLINFLFIAAEHWADVFMEIIITTAKCYSWAVTVTSSPDTCISLPPNISNITTYPHAYTCTGIFSQAYK